MFFFISSIFCLFSLLERKQNYVLTLGLLVRDFSSMEAAFRRSGAYNTTIIRGLTHCSVKPWTSWRIRICLTIVLFPDSPAPWRWEIQGITLSIRTITNQRQTPQTHPQSCEILPSKRSRCVARYATLSSRNCLSIFLFALRCFFSSSVTPPFLKHPIAHKCDPGTREDTPVFLWNKKLLFFRRRGSKILKLKTAVSVENWSSFLTHPGLWPLRHHGIHDREHAQGTGNYYLTHNI